MALQGDLDTFVLSDVLRLIAATGKSGRLEVEGDRGTAVALVHGGRVAPINADGPATRAAARVVFDLLRFRTGTFHFLEGPGLASIGHPSDNEEVIAEAEDELANWQDLERDLPAPGAWLDLAPEIRGDDVVLTREQWRVLATAGTGLVVREAAEQSDLSELDLRRVVRELIDAGALVLTEALSAPVDPLSDDEIGPARARLDAMAAAFAADDEGGPGVAGFLPEPLPAGGVSFSSAEPHAQPVGAAPAFTTDGPADASADADASAGADRAASADGPPDRRSLVRFLSSVKD